MSQTTESLKAEFKKSKELLGTLRDEVRVKLHLAGMDAKSAWKELNAEAERASREIGQTSQAALAEMVAKLRELSAKIDAEVQKSAPTKETKATKTPKSEVH